MRSVSELAWDSGFFGVKVGRLDVRNLHEEELESSLENARKQDYRLIYIFNEDTPRLPDELTERFGGTLVDHRMTFQGEIHDLIRQFGSTGTGNFEIAGYPKQSADQELLQLGLLAGSYSRFRTDSNIPDQKFVELYQSWVDQSTRREIADQVFVATHASGVTAGLITLTIEGDRGVIGLVAVSSEFQGQGIGTSLLASAHQWMATHNVVQSRVVTQRENTNACRLYTKTGYTIQTEQVVYHFWL